MGHTLPVTFDNDDFELLKNAVYVTKDFDSYSAAIRRAVRTTFGKKEGSV